MLLLLLPFGVCTTLNVVSIMTLLWATVAPMTGVSVFDTTNRVSYSHKRLTPLFGVTVTPSFLQCNNSLSAVGLAAGIAVVISLLVVLPVGVVISCCGMWCLIKRSVGQEDLPGNIYDVPSLTDSTFPLSDEAYGFC